MAQKKITDLQLRSSFDAECNVPVDDASQTWRATGEQIKTYVLAAGNVGTAQIADNAVTGSKVPDGELALAKLAAAVQAALVPTGSILPFAGTAAPTGWILASGGTIGSSSSGATARANADTATLYALLWGSFANTELAIQASDGTASTRGASAAADFAANKRLPVPDLRGRVVAGKDDMGGSAASRLTSALTGSTLGAAGGSQTHTLTTAEMPSHAHDHQAHEGGGGPNSRVQRSDGGSVTTYSGVVQATGGGGAHNNTQPTYILNQIIKL